MNRAKVIDILRRAGYAEFVPDKEWVQFSCPFAPWLHAEGVDNSPSFSFNTKTFNGHCFACGVDISLWMMLRMCGGLYGSSKFLSLSNEVLGDAPSPIQVAFEDSDRRFSILNRKKEMNLTGLWRWFDGLPDASTSGSILDYLASRGFSDSLGIAKEYDLRWDDKEERVVFPMWDVFSGKFLGAQGRIVKENNRLSKVYKKAKSYFGTEKAKTFGCVRGALRDAECVLLVEGPYDAMKCSDLLRDYGEKVVPACMFSWNVSAMQLQILEKLYKPVWALLDNDQYGEMGMMKLQKALFLRVPSFRGLRIVGKKDPALLTKQELVTILDR